MPNEQDFECQQCGAHFDSRERLDRHNKQQHTQQAGSSNISSSPSNQSGNKTSMGSPQGSSSVNRDRDLRS